MDSPEAWSYSRLQNQEFQLGYAGEVEGWSGPDEIKALVKYSIGVLLK